MQSIFNKENLIEYQRVKEYKAKIPNENRSIFFIPVELAHILPESSSIMVQKEKIVLLD